MHLALLLGSNCPTVEGGAPTVWLSFHYQKWEICRGQEVRTVEPLAEFHDHQKESLHNTSIRDED